ncbi:SRPBCC family protein [Inquilinus limosus]|uniref:SRPBCC family protein n=1 Tax=Inquilinus limosus TaxID=171674 RepID=UPI003F153AB7
MTPTIDHSTFVVERELPGGPAHAFRFWAESELKRRWTDCHPDWAVLEDLFDFRVGGAEAKRWRTPEGHEQTFRAHYLDILPGRRIIYAYEMGFRGQRVSASLATVELFPEGDRTRMRFTEQVAFLGGGDDARRQRVGGTEAAFDGLADVIRKGLAGLL